MKRLTNKELNQVCATLRRRNSLLEYAAFDLALGRKPNATERFEEWDGSEWWAVEMRLYRATGALGGYVVTTSTLQPPEKPDLKNLHLPDENFEVDSLDHLIGIRRELLIANRHAVHRAGAIERLRAARARAFEGNGSPDAPGEPGIVHVTS